MTLPRQVLPGSSYMITRRCSERRFFLRPSPEVNQTYLYCLGLAAERHGLEISSLCAMSNHCHETGDDVRGELPNFAQQFHGNLARALNAHLGRGEAFWSPGTYSAVECADREAMLERMVYVITNPVAAGLVERPEEWPGLCTLPEDVGVKVYEVERPKWFFHDPERVDDDHGPETGRDRRRRRGRGRAPLPERVRLKITKPRAFADMPDDEFRRLLRARVDERLAELHAQRREAGLRYLGAKAILAQDPFDAPAGGTHPDGSRNRRIACTDKWKRVERLRSLVEFWTAHAEARAAFSNSIHDVLFPPGTWAAVRVYGARASPP